MAVHVKPCHGCPLGKGCQQRQEFRARVAGLGLRSATFNCQVLAEKLKPGTRIVVAVPVFGADEYGDEFHFAGRKEVEATITASKGNRFACLIDEKHQEFMVDNGGTLNDPSRVRFRKMQNHTRIVRWLDEPLKAMCEFGNVRRDSGGCDVPAGQECSCAQNAKVAA